MTTNIMDEEKYYVSTTYGTTWMGSLSSMRDDYNYGDLFIGTYEECLEELSRRRN
jgi:hypothetical protein